MSLSSRNKDDLEILNDIKVKITNEYVTTSKQYGNFDLGNNLDFPLLKAYHSYVEEFVKENNIQTLFWGNGNIKTSDRVYFFQKLKYLELLDLKSHEFRIEYWKSFFKNPVPIYDEIYDGFPEKPCIKWQTNSLGISGKPLLDDKMLEEHFNIWALNNYPLFPCTNGETLKMSEVILPSCKWFFIKKFLPILDLRMNREKLNNITYRGEVLFKFRTKPTKKELRESWRKKYRGLFFK